MKKCSKCLTEDSFFVDYAYVTDKLILCSLCHICNSAYNQNLLVDFMSEDFGRFPISKVSKNMINARIRRSSQKETV